jgi:Flp pilus assembly pilin Flp
MSPIVENQARATQRSLLRDARGATFTQYVILVACVALPALAAYAAVGPKLADKYVKDALSIMGLPAEGGE